MKRRHWWLLVLLAVGGVGKSAGQSDGSTLRLLAFGDVNLGRTVGQRLLRGELDYPFARLRDVFRRTDIVLVNLESVITDQHGETEDPGSNTVFCAPPSSAFVLRDAGVTVVAGANNHAFDYGEQGVRETVRFLAGQRVACVGLSADPTDFFQPVVLERKGIRVGFAAYTQFVNRGTSVGRWIAVFDSGRVRKELRALREASDLVVVSYHGGKEYADSPGRAALAQMRSLVDAGADLVIGHHAHVPQGIEEYAGRLIFTSLGNLMFLQAREWTQLGWGAEFVWTRTDSVRLTSVRLLPVRAGYQPSLTPGGAAVRQLAERLRTLTTVPFTVQETDSTIHVQPTFLHP
jgi:poly-gamma-glutamate synthesis protein (capsule biosynthesis protein)